MSEQTAETGYSAVALTEDERIDLAERIRVAFDTPPDERVVQDTWIYAAAMAEQWYVDRENLRAAAIKDDHEARSIREVCAALADHPVTEHGTTRCPNEGWIAAEIDSQDGTCSACGEVVIPPGAQS